MNVSPLNISGNTTPQQNAMLQQFLGEAAREASRFALEHLDQQSADVVLEMREKVKSEFLQSVVGIMKRHTVSDRHKDEETPSRREYPAAYKVRPIEAQVTELRTVFPNLWSCMEKIGHRPVPEGAEGWFAVPRWEMLGSTYNEAVQRVLHALARQRRFSNRIADKIDALHLRQTSRAERAWQILSEQQPENDLLVIAAQVGMQHRGRSARRTRAILRGNEFGLGALAMGCILLTHPERMSAMNALMIDCCGDEYSMTANGHYDRVPLFDYDLGGLQFSVFYEDRAWNIWGSPSGFLFQMG